MKFVVLRLGSFELLVEVTKQLTRYQMSGYMFFLDKTVAVGYLQHL